MVTTAIEIDDGSQGAAFQWAESFSAWHRDDCTKGRTAPWAAPIGKAALWIYG
jgi:hypothetical protein